MSVSRLQVASRFVRHRFAKLHVFEVQAVLLNDCNLRCSYCSCPYLGGEVLTTEQWMDLIARFRAAGTLRIKWQGGEPTIRRDFALLCEAVRSHGIICAVVTNGIAIARNPALLTHLDEVVVSVDAATPENHDKHRGEGSHALALRAIDEARARGRRVYVNMVVTKDTLHEVPAMLEFCERRQVGLNVQPAMFSRKYQRQAAMHLGLSAAEEQALERQLAQWRREGRPLMFAAEAYEHAAHWPDYTTPTSSSVEKSGCMAGRFYVHVEPNGDVLPCVLQDSPGFVARNLIRDGFEATLLHVRDHHCNDCFLPYLNERKALFALRPAAVLAWIRRG